MGRRKDGRQLLAFILALAGFSCPVFVTPIASRYPPAVCGMAQSARCHTNNLLAHSMPRSEILKKVRTRAIWSESNCGSRVELVNDGTNARRKEAARICDGDCVVVSAKPMAVAERPRGQTHYGEIKIIDDSTPWNGGVDIGVTALSPAEIGEQKPEDLRWFDLEKTWVVREDGMFRFRGRSFPRNAERGLYKMKGFDATILRAGDTLGIRVEQESIVTFLNGRAAGRLDLKAEEVKIPVDGDLYLVVDVVGKPAEVELLDVAVPE